MNQDTQLETDMDLYQFFKITGVQVKLFFPMPTTLVNSPVQWALAYSPADVLLPSLAVQQAQTLASY